MSPIGVRPPARPLLLFAAVVALAINQLRVAMETWGNFILRHPGYADFGSYYVYAQVGLRQGWSHLYDLAAQRQEWLRLGGPDAIPWFPIIYPPPLAWVIVPFTLLPMPLAFACWTGLLLGLVLLSFRLVSPGGTPLARWTGLAAMLAVFPVLFGILLGQILIVELAAIAVAWRLLARGHDVPAGLVLTALVFKPQVAILLPLVLLLIGRWRTVLAWGAGSAVVASGALLTTGLNGLHEYALRLADAAAVAPEFVVPTQFTLAGLLGHGVLTVAVSGLLITVTAAVAYRHRHEGTALPVAAALVGSMLVTPYLHYQDLSVLLLAGAVALQGPTDRWQRWLLVVGYALVLATSYWGFGTLSAVLGPMLVLTEAAWLVAGWRLGASGRASSGLTPLRQIPLDRTA